MALLATSPFFIEEWNLGVDFLAKKEKDGDEEGRGEGEEIEGPGREEIFKREAKEAKHTK